MIAITTLVIIAAGVFAVTSLGGGTRARVARSTKHAHTRDSKARTASDRGTSRHTGSSTVSDPLTTAAAKSWIASRQGKVSAAVYDIRTGREWLLNPSARDQTASIIKADILETLMYQTVQAGKPLADVETDVAEDMIEESSDTDASELWDQIGEAEGLADYNAKAGLTQTTPNTEGMWGVTLTSAADQIKVLKQLAFRSGLLSSRARKYELYLMHNIDAGQNWGVTGGVPDGVSVALKNGWVPLTSYTNWEINSIGWVHGDDHDYLIAVLTAHDPSEDYGIETIDHLSAEIYATLGTDGLSAAQKAAATKVTPKSAQSGDGDNDGDD